MGANGTDLGNERHHHDGTAHHGGAGPDRAAGAEQALDRCGEHLADGDEQERAERVIGEEPGLQVSGNLLLHGRGPADSEDLDAHSGQQGSGGYRRQGRGGGQQGEHRQLEEQRVVPRQQRPPPHPPTATPLRRWRP